MRGIGLGIVLAMGLAGAAGAQGTCANGRCARGIQWLSADEAMATPVTPGVAVPASPATGPPRATGQLPIGPVAPEIAPPAPAATPVCVYDIYGRCIGGDCRRPTTPEHSVVRWRVIEQPQPVRRGLFGRHRR